MFGVGHQAASASPATTVTGVTGRALGYVASIGLEGQPPRQEGPPGTAGCDANSSTACSPSVTLPPTGAAQTATDSDGATATDGRAVILRSTSMTVDTHGTRGDTGSVASSASATNVVAGPFTAAQAGSSCQASDAGLVASATISGGRLVTAPGAPATPVAASPAPNTAYTGTDASGAGFRVVFNEQITNPDGSLTVNAYHQLLLGPSATGELILGQAVCGVTLAGMAGILSSLPVPPGAPAPIHAAAARQPSAAGTKAAAATGSAAIASVPLAIPGGTSASGAYGFYASVSLFGGPATPSGLTPKVELPAAGSDTPITATDPTGKAQYGPASIYESTEMKVSTQGKAGSTTSSASAADIGPTQVTAKLVTSTCTADASGLSGSASFTAGKILVSLGPDLDTPTADDTVVDIPANPPPNTSFDGKLENTGDTFKVVVNEQEKTADAITVNGVHLILQGPIAKGDVVIAQSRCSKTGAASTPGDTGTPAAGSTGGSTTGGAAGTTRGSTAAGTSGTSTRTGSTARTSMAKTGVDPPLVPGLVLVALGSATLLLGRSRRRARPEQLTDDQG